MTPPVRRRVRGLAHIELALILMFMGMLLPLIFSFGRIFYVTAALKQANSDAAASLAAVPMAEWAASASETSPMKLRALAIARQSLADSGVMPTLSISTSNIGCRRGGMTGHGCGGPERPESITVSLGMDVPMLGIMGMFGVSETLYVLTNVTVPYNN